MDFDGVILLPRCFGVIRTTSRSARGIETGGPLVGYIDERRQLVVCDATGPGPRAKLERYSVTIDGEHAQKFCDHIYRESGGRIDYVGDWHKHTGISLQPSEHDIDAMRIMANFEFSPTKFPMSLIYRRWPEAFQVYVWNGSGALVKVPSRVSRANGAN